MSEEFEPADKKSTNAIKMLRERVDRVAQVPPRLRQRAIADLLWLVGQYVLCGLVDGCDIRWRTPTSVSVAVRFTDGPLAFAAFEDWK